MKQIYESFEYLWDCIIFSIIFITCPSKYKRYSAIYYLLCFLVKHSYIEPKSPTFDYLNEKPINTNLTKFLGFYPSVLSQFLVFISVFFTSSTVFHDHMLSLNKSKRLVNPLKFHVYGTIVLLYPWSYYPLTCIYITFFVINRSTFTIL